MLKLLAAASVAFFMLSTGAFADDCPAGTGKDALLAYIAGDTIAADASVPGEDVDEIILDVDKQGVWEWALKAGCVIASPRLLDDVAAPAAPAPAPPAAKPSGLELGA